MISVSEALSFYNRHVTRLDTVSHPLAQALGRVLAERAPAQVDLPPFSQSAMDGYALRAADTRSASASAPARLRVSHLTAAGPTDALPVLEPGHAARILTGAPLLPGADAVIRQEIVTRSGDSIEIAKPIEPGCDLRWKGEELSTGETVVPPGLRLHPGTLAALAHAGAPRVTAARMPRVTCVITGDELVPAGQPLEPGQIYGANDVLVTHWFRATAILEVNVLHARDTPEDTERMLSAALQQSDLVITTGGVSVGDRDHVVSAAEALGVNTVFWRVRQQPGKPLYFGVKPANGKTTPGQVLVLGLPGNPGSVYACLLVHVRRVLDLLEGVADPEPRLRPAVLSTGLVPDADRARWVRCSLIEDDEGRQLLTPLPRQSSHMISNLDKCRALALVPPGHSALREGALVTFVRCPVL